jgi:hypothetical protein
VPSREHPELAKMFREFPASTCAACLLKDSDISNRDVLIEVFERLAHKAMHLAHGICSACREYRAVIHPA